LSAYDDQRFSYESCMASDSRVFQNNMTSTSIKPHWLGLLFSQGENLCRFTDEGLCHIQNGSKRIFSWTEISTLPTLSYGLFFCRLNLATEDGTIRVGWLSKFAAESFLFKCQQHWYASHASRVTSISLQLKAELTSRYLRTSRWPFIQKAAKEEVSRWQTLPTSDHLPNESRSAFNFIYNLALWDNNNLEAWRSNYVSKCRIKYRDLFEPKGGLPLTDRQQEACIIDEDNNLVIAGAGTGKTSTMVGRAEFLISSGQAKPNEILMLAYGKKAADEMRDRVEKNISQKGINAQTFHSLGLSILSEAQNGRPTITPLAEDEKLRNKHVDLWLEELLHEKSYRKKVLKYFERYLYPSKNAFDFDTEGEYFAYQEANELRTYKGECVKSYEELIIANWLFRMGVEYEYEARYKIATRTTDFRDYHPDFYLPGSDIYIEHFGVRRDGSTAAYIDQKDYWAGIEWKRLLHEKHKTTLIETYSYENFEGNLLESLQQKLEDAEVTLDPLPDEAVLETLREFGAISKFSELLGKLLVLYKANGLHRGHQANLQKDIEQSPQMKAALELLQPILDRYQQRLESQGAIDFEDMIIEAIEIVSEGKFKHPWKFIMVDEFQDISEPRASLVEKLRDAGDDISLFCVGDDWQAIYRFAGSDINIISGFEGFFGETKTTCLDKTFRFNDSICDISSKFVMQNQAQIEKTLITPKKVETPSVSLFRGNLQQTVIVGYLKTILSKIQERASDNATVYLLARYRFELFESQDLRSLKNHVPNLHLNQLTFHGSKGKEADYVIVLGLLRGKHGFPSEKTTDPLLNQLLPVAEPFPFAEERRLFYVAMTRARHRVYLVTDMTEASTFVTELLVDKYPLEFNEFDTELSQKFAQDLTCPKCMTGHLVPQESEHGAFYGCSHFPRCKHTEDGCRKCGLPMKRGEGLRVCIDESCGERSPVCKRCSAEMRIRKGPRGEFWGCKNYRYEEEAVRCVYTCNLEKTLQC